MSYFLESYIFFFREQSFREQSFFNNPHTHGPKLDSELQGIRQAAGETTCERGSGENSQKGCPEAAPTTGPGKQLGVGTSGAMSGRAQGAVREEARLRRIHRRVNER